MSMKERFLQETAEETNHSLKCALNILETIHMTMERDENPKAYTNALFGLWEYISQVNENLEEALDAVHQEQKEKQS